MSYKHIRYEQTDRIARVILNPSALPQCAVAGDARGNGRHAFTAASRDDDVRVVILKVRATFSVGLRPRHARRKRRHGQAALRQGSSRAACAVVGSLHRQDPALARPRQASLIAQVHGFCIFGGWMFAAAMDLIVASEDAMFLPSLLQYFSIPWDVGVRKAKEILYQSRL